ncbi:Fasciclin domain-containing protein [Podospora fimiseda]|uniref:Fasciclin domain-containing protein n=1 Tax=Podospora fimiseda TaxID=252190 RepID=A0AAN7BVT0_9PEZI|nr:Fasciclin domain-containing protein [Podospora fimiseda]
MKLPVLFAATAAALATVHHEQVPFIDQHINPAESAVQDWWDTLRNPSSLLSPVERKVTETIRRTINNVVDLDDTDDNEDDNDHPHQPPHRRPPGRGHRHHGDKTKTIYDQIKESRYTTKFAKLVEEHDEIKSLLDDTGANHTIFVPTDKAFDRIPHHPKDPPPKEFILALLKYHALAGLWPVPRILHSYTLPTELSLETLGDNPQRLRVNLGLFFTLHINLYSKVVAGNIEAKNGFIHAVDGILVPPPTQAKIISLLPTTFSTFSLALEKTGLGEELEKEEKRSGGTLFAPTNKAFQRLGPMANAFLFSERGKKYLKALLKYHVVLGETLYSDAFYKPKKDDDEKEQNVETGYWHVDLPSLLDDKAIAVDVKSWKGFVTITLNGFNKVAFKDGLASDGSVHIINKVLIPPHKHSRGVPTKEEEWVDVSEEVVIKRLQPYLEEEKEEMRDL